MKTVKTINNKRERKNVNKQVNKQQLAGVKDPFGEGRQLRVADEKHFLKHRILKALKKRGTVQLDKLVMKLDARPSQVFKILKKLEHKGIVREENKAEHCKREKRHHKGKETTTNYHGHHHNLEDEGAPHKRCQKKPHKMKQPEKPRHHHHQRGKKGKRLGSLQFALNS